MQRCAFILLALVFCTSAGAQAITRATPKTCVHGLKAQPRGGPFSVFVFCDDALGVNIAVLNTSPGAGPGQIRLEGPRVWSHWQVNDRVWQDASWSTDITSFAWSRDLRSLYVATSGTYGSGALYRLSLVDRSYTRLLPKEEDASGSSPRYMTEVTLLRVDSKTDEIVVSLRRYDPDVQREVVTTHTAR